ncbi:MAG: hypothetical protein KBT12_06680 [Bacteroidales bacterium]|nr:hypothetical protein [Candidatus Physcousia equi]
MYKSNFGRNGQVRFSSPNEYYQLLGYLAKSDGTTSITWENNEDSGAWGSEGRIHFNRRNIPHLGSLKFTAGNGSTIYRVNCNPFVEHLSKYHGFVQGKYQNISRIRATIPPAYLKDFELGLKL